MFISEQFSIKYNALHKNEQIISPTKNTPEVILDPKGTIKLTGRLIPENADAFFNPIKEWINEYFCNPADITYVEIHLEYINIIDKITHIHLKNNKNKFIINWYYEDFDEDMLEEGTLFSSNLDVPFNFIRISR
jgi:hypothetical protein